MPKPPSIGTRSWRTQSLEQACRHMSSVFTDHRLQRLAGEMNFAHTMRAGAGWSLNLLQYGADVMVDAPKLDAFYLLQLTTRGRCEIQLGHQSVCLTPGQVCVISPDEAYRKRWSADCIQLIGRIDRKLIDPPIARSMRAATQPGAPFNYASLPAFQVQRLVDLLHGEQTDDQIINTIARQLRATMPANPDHPSGPAAVCTCATRRAVY